MQNKCNYIKFIENELRGTQGSKGDDDNVQTEKQNK